MTSLLHFNTSVFIYGRLQYLHTSSAYCTLTQQTRHIILHTNGKYMLRTAHDHYHQHVHQVKMKIKFGDLIKTYFVSSLKCQENMIDCSESCDRYQFHFYLVKKQFLYKEQFSKNKNIIPNNDNQLVYHVHIDKKKTLMLHVIHNINIIRILIYHCHNHYTHTQNHHCQ